MIKEWQLAAFASYRWPQRILEAFLLLSAFGGGLPGRPAAMRRLYILENNENTLISSIRRSNSYKLISGLMRYLHSVRFSFDVFEHMTDAKQILFGNWLNPFVFFHFQYWFIALQIKKTCNETHAISISFKANVLSVNFTDFRRQNCQSIVLNVKLAQSCQFADFTRNIQQIVVTQSKLEPEKLSINYLFERKVSHTNPTYDLQILQVADARWQKFEIIVAQVQSAQSFCKLIRWRWVVEESTQANVSLTHHEEIAGQCVLVQIIVGQIQHFKHGECTESTRQWTQTIYRYIENTKFWHRWQRHR